jgi:hypothetical protein
MIARCNEGKKIIDTHPSRDAASPGAAVSLKIAAFKPGTTAACKCASGACKPSECDELWISDEQGTKIACFYGRDWRAVSDASGLLTVFRMPAGTTQDASKRLMLSELNQIHREFYARPDMQ